MAVPYLLLDEEDDSNVSEVATPSSVPNLLLDDDEVATSSSVPNLLLDDDEVATPSSVPNLLLDDDDDITVGDTSPADTPVVEEEAPEGYEYVTELVTDEAGDVTIEKTLQEKVERFDSPEYTDPAFTYEDTGAAAKQLGLDIYDTISLIDRPLENAFGEEFTVEYVPEYLRPFVRVVGKGVDGLLVQPIVGTTADVGDTIMSGLNTTIQFGKESLEGIGAAVTRAVHENITSEKDAAETMLSLSPGMGRKSILAAIQDGAKLLDIEGTDIIKSSPKTAGKQLTRDAVMALETAGIASPPALLARQATAPFRQAEKEIIAATRRSERRIRVDEAKANEARIISQRRSKASKIVRDNRKEADAEARETIAQIESELLDGQSISRETKSGFIAIDYDKAIDLGRKKTDELLEGELAGDVELQDIVGTTNQLMHPIFNPEKFEPVLAALMKMKSKFPDAFKKEKHLEGPYKGRNKTFGQQLKDLVTQNTDEATSELTRIAEEFGLSRDDLANMMLSGDRIHGQALQQRGIALKKLRNAGKETPSSKLNAAQEASQKAFDDAVDEMSTITKNIKRIENITLGALTGTIGTAARNLESFIIRAPFEGLIKVMEEGVVQYARAKKARADKNFVGPPPAPRLTDDELVVAASRNPYATSLEALSNTFDVLSSNPKQMQELVDYIMTTGGKEYDQIAKKLYSNIEELQLGMGRGEGKFGDSVLSGLEDVVQILNAPNRWQEFHIRNGHYLGSIQQQIQREWGIDFISTVNKSGIKDFLNDSSRLRPKGAKSFNEILTEATDEALTITYASAPVTPLGRGITNFFRKTPFGSFFIAFPRFSIKAMEYLGASFAGAPFALARRAITGRKNPTDRKLMSRNMAGAIGVFGAYKYRMSENAPADYTKVYTPDGNELDTTYLIPLPQVLWIGELLAQWHKDDGDVSDFLKNGGYKDFVQLFTGTNFRAGQQLGTVFNNLIESISSDNALKSDEKVGKAVGDFIGSIGFRPFRPLTQLVDLERTLGVRDTEMRSYSSDPTMGIEDTAIKSISKPFRNQGITRSAEEERTFPRKVVPLKPEGDDRVAPALRLFAGMTIKTPSNELQSWLTRRNFRQQYLFEGRTGIDTVDDVITETFNNIAIPVLMYLMKEETEAMSNATTREERKAIYKETRRNVGDFINMVKSTASATPYKFRRGTVDEEGVRTTGTFAQDFVIALARVKGLSSNDLERGILSAKDTLKEGESLDFTDIDTLNLIAKAGKLRGDRLRKALKKGIPEVYSN